EVVYTVLVWCQPYTTLHPYTTLFRSGRAHVEATVRQDHHLRPVAADGQGLPEHLARLETAIVPGQGNALGQGLQPSRLQAGAARSEEHTSELQSRENLVCRLLHEK